MKNSQRGFAPLVWVIIAALVLGGGYVAYRNYRHPTTDHQPQEKQANADTQDWKTYRNEKYGFEFMYPLVLSVKQEGDKITLSHSIAYKHSNPCDFKGDAPPLEKFSDFHISFKVVNKNLKEFVQSSSYPGWDYVSKNPFTLDSWNGFKIMTGVEGCGANEYYLTISPSKTLVIGRSLITEFSNSVVDSQTYLNLPGVISPSHGEEFFTKILSALKFTK